MKPPLRHIRSWLSKQKFALGLNPRVDKHGPGRFVPPGYRAVLLVSADFELAWAWRYSKKDGKPIEKARTERENVPAILALCEKYHIPVTWATVGHLFLESCKRVKGVAHGDLPHPSGFENDYSKFDGGDWYEHDPCTDYLAAPEWYGPDLISSIATSPAGHEIACHTFSHIDCRDGVCPPALLRAELQACKQLAAGFGLSLSSFVHPGHTIGNLDVLAGEGFTSFRTDYGNVLGYPVRHLNGLWELKQTAEFAFRKEWTVDYHIYRYNEIIRRAIGSGTVCVFWFHPSFAPVMTERVLPQVFSYADQHRHDIWITTHQEYISWLESEGADGQSPIETRSRPWEMG